MGLSPMSMTTCERRRDASKVVARLDLSGLAEREMIERGRRKVGRCIKPVIFWAVKKSRQFCVEFWTARSVPVPLVGMIPLSAKGASVDGAPLARVFLRSDAG